MINLNKSIFVFCFSILLSQSPSFDFSYELKYGDGTGFINDGNSEYDLNFNENFLKINSNYKNYHLYLELEYSNPPVLGYSKTDIEDIISTIYFDAQFDDLYAKVGNIYSLYGAGLGFYTFTDQNIDFDNNLIGVELRYSINPSFELFSILGKSNLGQRTNPTNLEPDRFSDNDLIVGGFNYDTRFGYGHILYKKQKVFIDGNTLETFYLLDTDRSTIFDDDFAYHAEELGVQDLYDPYWENMDGDSLNNQSFVLGYGQLSGLGDIYFEAEKANYDKLLGSKVDGHRYYFSYGRSFGDLGFSYEFKDYDMAYDILTFTAPPTVAIESTSILAARNSHSINYGDEVGHQFELVKPLGDNFNFLANLSIASRHKTKNKIYLTSGTDAFYGAISEYESEFDPINDDPSDDPSLLELTTAHQNIETFLDIFPLELGSVTSELVYSDIEKPSFLDYLSFSDSDDFRSFYPYRQVYAEINGYIKENIYIKIGFDLYDEIIKYKAEILNQNDDELVDAVEIFLDEVVITAANIYNDPLGEFITGVSYEEYLNQFSLPEESIQQESSYDYTQAWSIPTQLTYDLGNSNSINLYLEYQSKTISRTLGDDLYTSSYVSSSYTHNGFWTVTLFHDKEKIDYDNDEASKEREWNGLDLSFDLEDYGQLSLFYGSQKGGRVCANGICADQPGFDGLKVTYRTFF